MLKLLKSFKVVIMLAQEKNTTSESIASTLWCLDFLLSKLEKWEQQSRRGDTEFRTTVNLS